MSCFQRLKPPPFLVSLIEQFIDGVTTVNSNFTSLLPDSEESLSQILLQIFDTPELLLDKLTLESLSVIVESLHTNKKTILKDNAIAWLSNSPDTELSQISDPVSILRDK